MNDIVLEAQKTPVNYTANLKYFKASDTIPDNPRPVFAIVKDSWKNPGKIAHYGDLDAEGNKGWYKVVEGRVKVRIRTPKYWTEIISEPAYKMFEADMLASRKSLVEDDVKQELRMDVGDAFYDILFKMEKESGAPNKVGDDIVQDDSVIMHFKDTTSATRYADLLTKYRDRILQTNDSIDDVSIEKEIMSKITSISSNKTIVTVKMDKMMFEAEELNVEKEEEAKDIAESLTSILFN